MQKLLALLFIIHFSLHGHISLSGTVIDADSKKAIPFVNIGIRLKNIGTCALQDGTFKLQVSESSAMDSLTFYMVGYKQLTLSIREIESSEKHIFEMQAEAYPIEEIVISTKKLTEQKFGITKYNPIFHLIDASFNKDDIFEIAQLIHLGKNSSKITSVNLFINESIPDSANFRINFYSYGDKKPQGSLLKKSILQKLPVKEGWLKFDLGKENIYLKGNVVVALEFIPGKYAIKYEAKLGGRTKSFVRAVSLDEWQTPPHHYRLFVTALTDETKVVENETEEDEAKPISRFYSGIIKDTFSIFVKLPPDYNKEPKKKYPVVCLLDANAFFDAIAKECEKKDVILVGIGYANAYYLDSLRDRDYTFPNALPTDTFKVSGGGENFYLFFKNELLPFIDRTYQTDTSYRTLMGHSLGGYFPLYVLKREIELNESTFTNYVSASPSLDYCNYYLLNQFKSLSYKDKNIKELYLTVGVKEGMTDFYSLFKILSAENLNSIKLKNEFFPKMHHMDTALPTFINAINKL